MNRIRARHLYRLWLPALLCAALRAAADTGPLLSLDIADANLPQFRHFAGVPALSGQVQTGLEAMGYRFAGPGETGYRLTAMLGLLGRQATPVGFSFNSGDSNPRGLNFQTALVLPVHCGLSRPGAGAAEAATDRNVAAGEDLLDAAADKLNAALAEQIVATCLETLQQAKLPGTPAAAAQQDFHPALPIAIQVENRPEPAGNGGDGNGNGAPAAQRDQDSGQTQGAAGTAPAAAAQPAGDAADKRIIIYNRGTPIILQFGPDRR